MHKDKTGTLKMRERKTQDWKGGEKMHAKVKNEKVENAGLIQRWKTLSTLNINVSLSVD